jgi:hypothetical protein
MAPMGHPSVQGVMTSLSDAYGPPMGRRCF